MAAPLTSGHHKAACVLSVLSSHDGGGRVEGEDDCDGRGGAGHGDGHLVLAPGHVVLAAGHVSRDTRVTRYTCHGIHVAQDTRVTRATRHLYGHPAPPAAALVAAMVTLPCKRGVKV